MSAHHSLIRKLIADLRASRAQVARLNSQVDELSVELEQASESAYYAQESASRTARRFQDQLYQAQEAARQAEADADYQSSQRRSVLQDLERARAWGNEWAASQAEDKLRRLASTERRPRMVLDRMGKNATSQAQISSDRSTSLAQTMIRGAMATIGVTCRMMA